MNDLGSISSTASVAKDTFTAFRKYVNRIFPECRDKIPGTFSGWISFGNGVRSYILVLVILISVSSISADNYSDWKHSQAFILNTTSAGADVSENVRNFPVLIRLNSEIFPSFSQILPGGADIRFAKSDGTHLPYQIERWDDNADDNDSAEIWVKLDTIYGNDAARYVKMYWGNPDAVDSSNSGKVFGASDGFMATHHLAGDLSDATDNNYSGLEPENVTTDAGNGIIGHARFFDGTSFYQIENMPDRATGTVSFWLRTEVTFNSSSATTQGVWGKTDGESKNANISLLGNDFLEGGNGVTGQLQIKVENNDVGHYNNSTTSVFEAGVWNHVAWRWGNGTDSIYINGILESAVANSQVVSSSSSDEIGRAYYDGVNITDGGPRYFNGTLDEFRIDTTARNSYWVKLCYENQKPDQALIRIVGTDRDLIITEPHDSLVPVGESVSFSVTAEGQDPLRYKWLRFPDDTVGNAETYSFDPLYPDDDSARFRCIVFDDFGTDTSQWATLAVIAIPQINEQTTDINVTVGDTASMSVSVVDSRKMVFAWRKTGSDTDLSTEKTYTVTDATFSDSGYYYCVLSNPAGTVISDTVLLTVNHIPPSISAQPVDLSVKEGDSAAFTISASGNAPPAYAWKKVGSDSILSTGATFSISQTVPSDSGMYYCIVSNPGGTQASDTVHLSIGLKKPVAGFSFSPLRGQVPLRIEFSDASTGAITSRQWQFGDDVTDTAADPVHTYSTPGRYTVSLIVTGPGGADTLTYIDTVYAYDENDPVNSVVIDSAYFDTLSDSIRITWCIDSTVLDGNPEVGITIGIDGYPTDPPDNSPTAMTSSCAETVALPNETIKPGSSCYVSIWFRMGSSEWIEPTEQSKRMIHIVSIPLSDSTVVSSFDSKTENDTIVLFNGMITVWKNDSCTDNKCTIDTFQIMTLDTVPPGLVPVGLPLVFKPEESEDSLFIGIRIDTLPHGFTLNDVRIYNRDDDVFLVDRQCIVDSVNEIVYVRTGKENRSFVAMLDTLPPLITFSGDTASPVSPTEQVMTRLRISDNIANVRWKYLYGRGDEVPQLHEQGDILTSGENLSLTISDTSEAICPETGLRALLIIDDGRFNDTINVSRSVFQVESGELNTGVKTWKPIYSTAILNDKNSTKLIGQLKQQQDIKGYSRRFMRLYRWINCKENENETDKWIEYDEQREDIQSLFTLEPGRILWLKTRKDFALHLDSGRTLSLKDTFTIDLPSGQWTDFSMPLRFGVRLEKILSATGKSADAILIYRWNRDSATDIYTLEPFYVRGMSDKKDRSVIFDYSKEGGYSLYNTGSKTVTLRIPPVPSVDEAMPKKKSYDHQTSWSTKFIARAVGFPPLPAVYFGYTPETDDFSYPLAPCFTTLRLSVLDRTTSRQYGHSICRNAKDGLVRELLISNRTDSTCSLHYSMEHIGAFPEEFKAYCYNPETASSDTCGTIIVAPQSSISRLIVIGDAELQKEFASRLDASTFSLHHLYPNPSRSIVNIRYTVPLGALEYITITIHNILGRKIREINTDRLLADGLHTIIWNGRDEQGNQVGSGIYIVRLMVKDRLQKKIRYFEKRVTILK